MDQPQRGEDILHAIGATVIHQVVRCARIAALGVTVSGFAMQQMQPPTEDARLATHGDSLLAAKSYRAAAAVFDSLTRRAPATLAYWHSLGVANYYLGDNAAGARAFEREAAGGSPFALYDLGTMYARLGRADTAFATLFRTAHSGMFTADHYRTDDDLTPLRSDPRFDALLDSADRMTRPCAHDAVARQLDFWLGEWRVENDQGRHVGDSRVELVSGDCALYENWASLTGSTGKSLNTFDKQRGQWRQLWIGQDGAVTDFARGERVGSSMVFQADERRNGSGEIQRLTFTRVAADTVRQHHEVSKDGGATWANVYLFTYVRKPSAAGVERGASAVSPAAGVTAIVDVSAVPMDSDRVLPHQTLIIAGGRITAIGPVGSVTVPRQARVIDGRGKFALPGLTDAHVHLENAASRWMPLLLANGVTTVFNMRGAPKHLALRDSIAHGQLVGPTIYTAGPYTNLPDITTPAEARRAAAQQRQAGYDFVKVHGPLSLPAYRALIAAAGAGGRAVVGHAPRNLQLDEIIRSRPAMIAHAEEFLYVGFPKLDTAGIAEVAARVKQAGIAVTPTLVTFANIVAQWARPPALDSMATLARTRDGLPEALVTEWRLGNAYTQLPAEERGHMEQMLNFQYALVRGLSRAGVSLFAGSDTPGPGLVPGVSLLDELDLLRQSGLSQFDVLKTATVNPHVFVRRWIDPAAPRGMLRPGERADVLLLNRDPLRDPSATRDLDGVMVRGRYFGRSALDSMRVIVQRLPPPVEEAPRAFPTTMQGQFSTLDGRVVATIVTTADGSTIAVPAHDIPPLPLTYRGSGAWQIAGTPARVRPDSTGRTLQLFLWDDASPLYVLQQGAAKP